MNPFLIAAGIYLSARVVSCITNTITDEDLKRQEELRKEASEIGKQELSNASNQNSAEMDSLEQTLSSPSKLYSLWNDAASKKQEETDDLISELVKTRKHVRSCLRDKANEIHTLLRRSSLELLLRQLNEAIEKCKSYQNNYLEAYKREIYKERTSTTIPEFSWLLPSDYPYAGKVVWINSRQVVSGCATSDASSFPIRIRIIDQTLLEDEEYDLPVMITKAEKGSSDFYASIELGAFKAFELTNTHLGFTATVKEIQKNYIDLVYKNRLKLRLNKDGLINPNRFPPVRSSVTVYPIRWEYTLSSYSKNGKEIPSVIVSEKLDDASSSLDFTTIPLSFQPEEFESFQEHLSLFDCNDELLIGLIDNRWHGLHKGLKLKVQLGDNPLLIISVDETKGASDSRRFCFRFDRLCNLGDRPFSADDVFVPLDLGFTPYFSDTSDELLMEYSDIKNLADISTIIWDIAEELRIQAQIRADCKGMGYFLKWESLTQQLISVLEQGDSVSLKVNWLPFEKRHCVFADVQDQDKLLTFVQQFAKKADQALQFEWKPQFFIKDSQGTRYSATLLDDGKQLRIAGSNCAAVFSDNPIEIELYAYNIPYAEYQQKTALRQFRIGQVVNPKIQAACLNSACVVSDQNENIGVSAFFNRDISINEAQRQIVERALKEKNIFFIQGPPGTGKTTVIKELIEQTFSTTPSARVLIVSQANIAVDNALSGLIEKHKDQIVRCGNSQKVSPKFKEMRLSSRCESYLNALQERKGDFPSELFELWEDTIISDEKDRYSPALCELIIRSHALIGATCVGLSKNNIGLDRTVFDLVIIDEAGKALPAELLIPLLRAKKAVIIGDQKQLPPVINPILYDAERVDLADRSVSENELFAHSFFERLIEYAPNDCKGMLNTQYRMPAVVGKAISELFYDGKLVNGSGTDSRQPVLFPSCLTLINYDGHEDYHEIAENKSVKTMSKLLM